MQIDQNKRKKWTDKELNILKIYILKNENMLLTVFYKNISQGKNIFKKEDGFFNIMGNLLQRKSSECKSKFQKHEKIIYCEYLNVPDSHYQIYQHCRKMKRIKKNKNKKLTEDLIHLKNKISASLNKISFDFEQIKSNL